MLPTQIWIVMKQSTNLELNEPIVEWNECEMLTHSQQQSQAPKTHKKESTVRLTTRITMLWALQRSLPYRFLVFLQAQRLTIFLTLILNVRNSV